MSKHSPRDTRRVRGLSREDLGINHGWMSGWPGEVAPGDASELASVQPVGQVVKDGRVVVVDIGYVDYGAIVAIDDKCPR